MRTDQEILSGDRCEPAVRRHDTALTEVATEWDDLHRRCPHATVFQSSAWLASWWREYGTPGGLRLALVHRSGRLVAGAALMVVRRGGLPVLRPVGAGISDWSDVLADPGAGAPALAALRAALLAEPGWVAVDLPEVAADGQAHRLLDGWPGRRTVTAASTCQAVPAEPIERLVGSLSSSHRADVRRALRKADAAGLASSRVPAGEVPEAVHRLLELHRRQWRDRGGMTPEHGRPRFVRHLARAVEGMVGHGSAALCEYTLDGELVASSLLMIGQDSVGGYLYGADPALFGRFNVTTLMMRTAMEVAVERAVPTFSMMRGREDYKTGWRPTATRNERLVLVRPGSVAGAGYAGSVLAVTSAIGRLRTHAPALRSAAAWSRRTVRNPRLALDESRALLGRAGRR